MNVDEPMAIPPPWMDEHRCGDEQDTPHNAYGITRAPSPSGACRDAESNSAASTGFGDKASILSSGPPIIFELSATSSGSSGCVAAKTRSPAAAGDENQRLPIAGIENTQPHVVARDGDFVLRDVRTEVLENRPLCRQYGSEVSVLFLHFSHDTVVAVRPLRPDAQESGSARLRDRGHEPDGAAFTGQDARVLRCVVGPITAPLPGSRSGASGL